MRQLGSGPKPCWVGKCREEMLSSEGLSEALVQEVASPGIHVTIVEPGELRTDFAGRSLVRAHREIAGYAQTSGATRKQLAQVNGHQAGDPGRAAQAMIQFVETAGPPLRLVLGGDALARMRGKLASVAQELEKWQDTTLATAFEETSAR